MSQGLIAETGSSLEYYVLDVFSETRLAGNQLAVVLNPGSLTAEMMQAIARETNLSETTFVERREAEVEHSEGIRVRIFTTQEELPFAGHPTLGTASLLKTIAPECMVDGTIALALKVGKVPVRFEAQAAGADLHRLSTVPKAQGVLERPLLALEDGAGAVGSPGRLREIGRAHV